MEPIELGLAAIAIPFLTKYVEKTGEGLGEKTLEQAGKLWQLIQRKPAGTLPVLKSAETEAFPVDFNRAIQELETAANEDQEVKQAVIDVVEVAKQESPEDVKNIEAEIEKIKSQGVTAEKINALFQGSTMSGGNIVESGNIVDTAAIVGSPEAFKGNTISGDVIF
ncbi:MAG: hypothetical protein F6K48_22105 [Okeania sp. SIO3H1]|uniref:hypothetical protein n=1 Tax=Okeania sp. SIO1I7 TaxID=2607772 RepID=UPI0013C78832|nr:hypothetical protein [Okeania sp. SIO1I7]NEN91450.1 hypothetical protein [Okeania sp. SIO3H1]NET27148.1 hypothetical protein [Okeania sp. SIO1I7]